MHSKDLASTVNKAALGSKLLVGDIRPAQAIIANEKLIQLEKTLLKNEKIINL